MEPQSYLNLTVDGSLLRVKAFIRHWVKVNDMYSGSPQNESYYVSSISVKKCLHNHMHMRGGGPTMQYVYIIVATRVLSTTTKFKKYFLLARSLSPTTLFDLLFIVCKYFHFKFNRIWAPRRSH